LEDFAGRERKTEKQAHSRYERGQRNPRVIRGFAVEDGIRLRALVVRDFGDPRLIVRVVLG
jgi:hypothetical protein